MKDPKRSVLGPVLGRPWPNWLRPALLAATVAVAGAAAVLAFALVPLLAEFEGRMSDRLRLALSPGPKSQDARISFVAIDEATMATLPYRSPLDRGLLSDVLEALVLGGASVVGLDVLLDQATEPEKDARLLRTIRAFPGTVVLAWADQRSGLTDAQAAWLTEFGAASGATFGDVNLTAGPQGVVRSHRLRKNETTHKSFATVLATIRMPEARMVEGLIDWRQSADPATPTFQTTPAHVLPLLKANPAILKSWFDGRIVIIGADLPLQDRHETPLSVLGIEKAPTPGALIHAHLVSQSLDGRAVQQLSPAGAAGLIVVLLAITVLVARNARTVLLKAGLVIAVLASYCVLMLYGVSQGLAVAPFAPAVLGMALTLIGMSTIDAMAARRDRQYIQSAFSQYLAPELVDRLIRNPGALSVGGERRVLSFLFTDIAGFTTLSEQMPADELTPLLNGYLDGICEIVIANHGVIDKFIGDAVVALFGVPEPDPAHAANAIECARQIDAFSEAFRDLPGHQDLGITRIGVHTGAATVGNFGGNARFDYTAIGDAMNTAARLEGANKYFGTRIAISGDCLSAASGYLAETMPIQPIGDIVLKGKTEPLSVVTLREGSRPGWLEQYNRAYCSLEAAPDAAATLLEGLGDDPVVAFHLQRLRSGQCSTVIVMAEK